MPSVPANDGDVDVDASVSATVRALAAAHQTAHAGLAALVGVGTTQFSLKMQGKAPWKLREVARLAAYFDVTVDDLIHGQVQLAGQQARSRPTPPATHP